MVKMREDLVLGLNYSRGQYSVHSRTFSFNKYCLATCFMSDTVLGFGDISKKNPYLLGLTYD